MGATIIVKKKLGKQLTTIKGSKECFVKIWGSRISYNIVDILEECVWMEGSLTLKMVNYNHIGLINKCEWLA